MNEMQLPGDGPRSRAAASAAEVVAASPTPAPAWLVWAGGAIAVATALGAAFAPYLLVKHPFWLLALNPWPRHQLLVAPQANVWPFVVIVGVRSLLSCAVSFELGRHYGVRGAALLEGHAPDFGRVLRTVEQLFGRFWALLLVLTPGWLTSALAGMSGVSRVSALLLNAAGVVGWALVNHQLGGWLSPWTAPIVQFLRDHVLVATVLCAAVVLMYQLYTRRKRRTHKRN